MSKDCYLIGVGGSGSKCIDNYTYMCAAGLGPENLWMGIVDQDQPNGNVNKAKTNITEYQNLYTKLKSEGQNNISSNSNLFKTNIRTEASDLHWTPIDGVTDPTLKELFEYDILKEDLQHLMECLYHSENDLELSLKEGFRGRPSIGTAAMIAKMQEDVPFWQNIFDALNDVTQGREIRIFLVSSIFGGTGASGFPSIARLIRSILKAKGITENIHIGGSLLLPYFTFPKPDDATDLEDAALADTFLQQSRGALDYYHKMFDRNKVFDELYLVGWDPLIKLNYFDSGGVNQTNPPLMPELYSCLAASSFFNKEVIDESDETSVFHIGRDNDTEFNWGDLPSINKNSNEVKNLLGQFTRTAFSFKYDWIETLTTQWKSHKGSSWFTSLVKDYADLNDTNTQDLVVQTSNYFDSYLLWVSSIINHSKSNVNDTFNLIETNQFSTVNDEKERTGIELTKKIAGSKNFETLVSDNNCNSAENVFEEMSEYKKLEDQSGIGVFINALYYSCRSMDGK